MWKQGAVLLMAVMIAPAVSASPLAAPAQPSSSELAAFERAWAEDTAGAFQQFLKAFPRSTSTREARTRLEYLKAVAPGTIPVYEQFLRQQPDHAFAGEAKKTLLGLRLTTPSLRVLISLTRLRDEGLNLASVQDELWRMIQAELTSIGFSSAPARPGEAPGPGGLLALRYEEAIGEEFFEGPLSVLGMAEPIGRGTTITAHLRLTVPGAAEPLFEETLTAATTLITSGDLRQSAVENFLRGLGHTLRSRLPVADLQVADSIVRGPAKAVAARGGYVYVASGAAGLRILDVRAPSAPKLLAAAATAADALDVAVAEGVAYVVVGHQGLQLFDVKIPHQPRSLGRVGTPAKALTVTVNGRYAYVACGNRGLAIIDVSEPGRPQIVATMDTPEWAFSAAIMEGVAYVADRRTLQLLDPVHRRPISQVLSREMTETVAVSPSGRVVYTGNRAGGIQIIRAVSPSEPQILATLNPPYLETAMLDAAQRTGDVLIVADGRFGPRLLDLRRQGEMALRLVPVKTTWAAAHTHNALVLAKGMDGLELRYLSPHMLRLALTAARAGAGGMATEQQVGP